MSSIRDMSWDDLQAARTDIDHQINSLRERKLAIAKELERRLPQEEPEVQPAVQVITPGFIESEERVPSLDDPPPEPEPQPEPKRKRWW